jgi:anthranilate synthase component I
MISVSPSLEDFETHAKNGKSQLVWAWAPADLETPLSVYLKLTHGKPHSFLLESIEGGEKLGRYSVIGFDPDVIWSYDRNSDEDALKTLRRLLHESHIDIVDPSIPPMGPSGLFGYMGYDMVRLVEAIPDKNPDPLGLPDCIMIRPSVMVIFDNVQNKLCITVPVRDIKGSPKNLYEQAKAKIQTVLDSLNAPIAGQHLNVKSTLSSSPPVSQSMEKAPYMAMVERAKDYIRAGDIFQVVLGIRYSMPFDLPALSLYRSLRRTNPSPFMFYMNFGGFHLVGSSPEILVRVRNRVVTIRPIAGTRKRGKTGAEDEALAQDLLNDPKERAEHLMLLDLGRNDVGRVSKSGTVRVTDQFMIEKYSHVMHIVSNVEGDLRDEYDALDALFAGFPAGTVSGAPKIRAMEIIDELEPLRRSYYAGCVGYLSGNGDMDTCIALRTAVVKDKTVYVQASGGIVADSVPALEYEESVNKAKAIISAAHAAIEQAS